MPRRTPFLAAVLGALVASLAAVASPAVAAPAVHSGALDLPLPRIAPHAVARQVANGSAVSHPARTVPWALSLWLEERTSDGTGTGTLQFLCTATAIRPRVLLTAAHCTRESGFLYVGVGADVLNRPTRMIPVEAIGANTRYRDSAFHDDIALLRPMRSLALPSYAHLAPSSVARDARAGRAAMTVYGWGTTETGSLTGSLRTARLKVATSTARRVFPRIFDSRTMIAAGTRNSRTGRWSGACPGDSGGPLVVRRGRTTYVVGVTNYGRYDCASGPTVFASVADFHGWTSATTAKLAGWARTRNTALPVPLTAPRVTGTVGLRRTLTCHPGTWTSNVSSVEVDWYRDDEPVATGQSYVLRADDAGSSVRCVTFGSSRAGYRADVAPVVRIPDVPTVTTPTVRGVTDGTMPTPGAVATCTATASKGATLDYDWLVGDNADPAGATVVGQGAALTLTEQVLRSAAGRYLLCRATATGAMGSATDVDSVAVPAV